MKFEGPVSAGVSAPVGASFVCGFMVSFIVEIIAALLQQLDCLSNALYAGLATQYFQSLK